MKIVKNLKFFRNNNDQYQRRSKIYESWNNSKKIVILMIRINKSLNIDYFSDELQCLWVRDSDNKDGQRWDKTPPNQWILILD